MYNSIFLDLNSNPGKSVDDQWEESKKKNWKIIFDRNGFVERKLSDADVEVARVQAWHHDVHDLRDDGEPRDPQVEKDLPDGVIVRKLV